MQKFPIIEPLSPPKTRTVLPIQNSNIRTNQHARRDGSTRNRYFEHGRDKSIDIINRGTTSQKTENNWLYFLFLLKQNTLTFQNKIVYVILDMEQMREKEKFKNLMPRRVSTIIEQMLELSCNHWSTKSYISNELAYLKKVLFFERSIACLILHDFTLQKL